MAIKIKYENLWLCTDCTQVAVNDDYSRLDYYLTASEAEQRIEAIHKGLDDLGPMLCIDNSENEWECSDCHHRFQEDRAVTIKNPDCEGCRDIEEGEFVCETCSLSAEVKACPGCESDRIDAREAGHEEFSRSDCDCCGTHLAGERFRFCILEEDNDDN